MIAALQTAAPAVGASALSLLQSPQQQIEAVLAAVVNDLDAISNDVVPILDDYHLIHRYIVDHLVTPRVVGNQSRRHNNPHK